MDEFANSWQRRTAFCSHRLHRTKYLFSDIREICGCNKHKPLDRNSRAQVRWNCRLQVESAGDFPELACINPN
jgi:hypothetical protein